MGDCGFTPKVAWEKPSGDRYAEMEGEMGEADRALRQRAGACSAKDEIHLDFITITVWCH